MTEEQLFTVNPRALRDSLRSCLVLGRCSAKSDDETSPETAYRTGFLADAARQVFPRSCHTPWTAESTEAFSRFLQVRNDRTLTIPEGRASVSTNEAEAALRTPRSLLLTDWQSSLFDGATMAATAGFFDEEGMPPWDTWLQIVEQEDGSPVLLSYVPPAVAEQVDSAIGLDAAQCMAWCRLLRHDQLAGDDWGHAWNGRMAAPVPHSEGADWSREAF